MTRAELFFKKGFEVCLLNKVFAVIIRLHIKVQTHLMLDVTGNCYHLMALWAELPQKTPHALRLSSGHCPGGHQVSGQHSDCAFPRVASWVINLTVIMLWPWAVGAISMWSRLFATLISLAFFLLASSAPIYLWGPEKSWWVVLPGCHCVNSDHGNVHLKARFSRRRERGGERDWLGCPGWVSFSSVVLKGKTVFNFHSALLPSSRHVKPIWEQKGKFYMAHFKHLAAGENLTVSEREISFLAPTPESFTSTQKGMEVWKLVWSDDKHRARIGA